MKKLISLFVVLAMSLALALPASAEDTATANTMRLESTEGTVTVKNASGLSVKLSDKMRLYDGYSVKTAASSYAYISLDGTKTMKLDASSEASVSKSGKKLEIALVSGSLFFNVTQPLQSDESLNIRTSTMVTGVRGTSACVSTPDRDHTEIMLLTGHLEVTGCDSRSGRMETVDMFAGEHITVAQLETGTPQEHMEIQKTSAQEQELPGFAAIEVAGDPDLQSKIAAETEMSVPLIIEGAAERLAADESAAQQAAAAVQEELEQQEKEQEQPDTVKPVFDQTGSGGSGDDSSGDDSPGGGTTQPVVPEDPDHGSVRLDDPTPQELADAMASAVGVVDVYLTGGLTQDVPLEGVEKTMTLHTGTLTNANVMTLRGATNIEPNAAIVNRGTLTVTGALSANGPLTNSGILHVGTDDKPGKVTLVGPYSGSGQVTMAAGSTLWMNETENSLSITAGPGSKIEISASGTLSVLVDNMLLTPAGGKYSYTNDGSSDVNVQVQQAAPAVTHTVTIQGENVTADPAMTNPVAEGGTFTFRLSPAAGYAVTSVTCGGQTLTPDTAGSYSVGPVNSDMTITVVTERITHTVTIEGSYFTAGPATPAPVADGEYFSFKLTPAEDYYKVDTVTCGDETLTADPTTGGYSVGPVTSDMVIKVMMEMDPAAPTQDSLQAALNDPAVKTVKLTGVDLELVSAGSEDNTSFHIPTGKALNITSNSSLKVLKEISIDGTLTVDGTSRLTFDYNGSSTYYRTVSSSGTLTVEGALMVGAADLINSGTLTIANGATAQIDQDGYYLQNCNGGKMTISGTMTVSASGGSENSLQNDQGGKLTVGSNGILAFSNGGRLANSGEVNVDNSGMIKASSGGKLENGTSGELTVKDGANLMVEDRGTLTNDGTLTNSGTLGNAGTLTVNSGSTLTNNSTLTNSGTLENAGTLTNNSTLEIIAYGALTNDGTLTNSGTLRDNGTLTNSGQLTVNDGELAVGQGGMLTNNGTLTNSGTVTNGGTLEIPSGGTLENNGELIFSGTLKGYESRFTDNKDNTATVYSPELTGAGTFTWELTGQFQYHIGHTPGSGDVPVTFHYAGDALETSNISGWQTWTQTSSTP